MWWDELASQARALQALVPRVDPSAHIAPTAILRGAVRVEAGARIGDGACIQGPVVIGRGALVGNHAFVRGPVAIGQDTCIGFGAELKNAILGAAVAVGPQCYVADSIVEDAAYLGAQVRTSNHRLDRATVHAFSGGKLIDTGLSKLGCRIGAGASLGVQVIVLPGREIQPDTVFGPRVTVDRNLPAGRYRLCQAIEGY